MKKLSIVIVVVAMLALSVVPALAAGGPSANQGTGAGTCTGTQTNLQAGSATRSQAGYSGGMQAAYGSRAPYALSGTITLVNSDAQTITVNVACGNTLVKSYIGSDVALKISASTRLLLRNADGTATPISFADLQVGQTVSSQGSLVNGAFTASRVTVGALLNCLP
jgi:hypothetical protein